MTQNQGFYLETVALKSGQISVWEGEVRTLTNVNIPPHLSTSVSRVEKQSLWNSTQL